MYQRAEGVSHIYFPIQNLSRVPYGRNESLSLSIYSDDPRSRLHFSFSSSSSSSFPPSSFKSGMERVFLSDVCEMEGSTEKHVLVTLSLTGDVPLYYAIPFVIQLSFRGTPVEER